MINIGIDNEKVRIVMYTYLVGAKEKDNGSIIITHVPNPTFCLLGYIGLSVNLLFCTNRVGVNNKNDDHCSYSLYIVLWLWIDKMQQSYAYRSMDVKHELSLCICTIRIMSVVAIE